MKRKTVQSQILRIAVPLVLALFSASLVVAQNRYYVGGLGGVATLSGDARALINSNYSAFSLYDPMNGVALNLIAGWSVSDYASLQAGYNWNRNMLTLSSALSSPANVKAYEESRNNSEHSGIMDVLVYFRNRDSRLRPYLSIGISLIHLSSSADRITHLTGMPILPPRSFISNIIGLRVPVGMDVALSHGWSFRYTFSETISRNPISRELSPSGQHSLKNFQNSFGFLRKF